MKNTPSLWFHSYDWDTVWKQYVATSKDSLEFINAPIKINANRIAGQLFSTEREKGNP